MGNQEEKPQSSLCNQLEGQPQKLQSGQCQAVTAIPFPQRWAFHRLPGGASYLSPGNVLTRLWIHGGRCWEVLIQSSEAGRTQFVKVSCINPVKWVMPGNDLHNQQQHRAAKVFNTRGRLQVFFLPPRSQMIFLISWIPMSLTAFTEYQKKNESYSFSPFTFPYLFVHYTSTNEPNLVSGPCRGSDPSMGGSLGPALPAQVL